MANKKLSELAFVERGYGQVEPNHLSAQRTGQIYAQLPAAADIELLENGQFVKYDYRNGEVNFTGAGEWMLVYNEVKVYRDHQTDNDFAMIKGDYAAHVYSPVDGTQLSTVNAKENWTSGLKAASPYEVDSTTTPGANIYGVPALMKEDTTMVPRVFKTNIGDIFTTNTIAEESLVLGDELVVGDDGYLTKTAGENAGTMKWQVVKVYTMPDRQKGVKIMRIA